MSQLHKGGRVKSGGRGGGGGGLDRRPLNRPTRDNNNKPTIGQTRHSDTILPNSPPPVDGDDDPTDVSKPRAKEQVTLHDDDNDSGMSSTGSLDMNNTNNRNNNINNRISSTKNNVHYQQRLQQHLEGVDEAEDDVYEAKGSNSNNSNRATNDELERSYDFAKDEERGEKLRRMKEKEKREEEEKKRRKMERERNTYRLRTMGTVVERGGKRVVVTWVKRSGGVKAKQVKRALKDLARETDSVVPQGGVLYSICEQYDTYQTGGLYPLLHLSDSSGVVGKLTSSHSFLDPMALGPLNIVEQGLFEEVATVRPPQQTAGAASSTVLVVSAFKSIEARPNPKLVKEWKNWTGARAFLQDMMLSGLQCVTIKFLVKVAPLDDDGGFYYMLLTEAAIHKPSHEGIIVDLVQRFRVERWSGYSTVYRRHN